MTFEVGPGIFRSIVEVIHNFATQMPSTSSSKGNAARHDMSVILVTGSYDHEIRFWEAWSGICSRTIARGESGVRRTDFCHTVLIEVAV